MLRSLFSDPIALVYRLIAVVVALSFHEWGHAYAANKLGDPTARMMGRMTINPFKHLDPIGFICMVLVGFGWAKPVPINPNNFKKPRRDEIIVSLAGVGTNFLMAAAVMCVYMAVGTFTSFYSPGIAAFISDFYFINLGLLVFNLIPVPPLDGYQFAKNLLIRKVSPNFFWNVERYGSLILMVLLLSGAVSSIMTYLVNGIWGGMSWFFLQIFSLF